MPRATRPWFRLYVEAFSDRKLRRLPAAQRWVWAAILGAACDSPQRGRLYVAEGVPMTTAELAEFAGVKNADVTQAVAAMVKLNMLTIEDDVIVVTNWGKRQFDSDDVTARTKSHRERSKERSNDVSENVRRNAPETEERKTSNSPSSPGSRNVPAGGIAQVIRAYVESAKAVGVPTPEKSQDDVDRSARRLFAEGYDLDLIVETARNAAVGGWTDLARQMQHDAARANPASTRNGRSTTDDRANDAIEAGAAVARLQLAAEPERRAL